MFNKKTPESAIDNTPGRRTGFSPADAIPLGYGSFRVAAKPIAPVLHWRYRETKTSQFAFFSGLFSLCLGPLDYVEYLVVNGKPYQGWFKNRADTPAPGDTEEYVKLTIPKETPETFTLYWGTETQSGITAFAQSLVKSLSHPEALAVHPDYLGIALLGVQDMEAGQSSQGSTPPLPNIEVHVIRRSPKTYSFGLCSWGAHPIGCVYDILRDKRGGLGLPASLFDEADWTAKIDRMWDEGVGGMTGFDNWISPVLTKPAQAGRALGDILAHFDGHFTFKNGKLGIDWCPNDGTTIDATGLREISQHDLVEEPEMDAEGLDELKTLIAVTGLDYESIETDPDSPPLQEATETAQVPYALALAGEPRVEQINRPFFVRRQQLRSYAQFMALVRAMPNFKATLKIRRGSATHPDDITPLQPGDRINLDYAPLELDIVCRITEREEDSDKAIVTLKVQKERGAVPTAYVPALDPRASLSRPVPPDVARYVAAQLPPDMSDADDTRVAILAERPGTDASGFEVQFSPTSSWPGQVLDSGNTRWAVAAVLQTTMGNSDADITITVDGTGAEWGFLSSKSTNEQNDNTLLAYHGGEWMSVGTITPTGGGNYSVALKRARLGSLAASHAIGSVVYFIARADLILLTHTDFANVESGGSYNATVATKYFKIRPYNAAGFGNLTGAFSVVLRDPVPDAPTGLTASVGTGAIVELKWNAVTAALVNEYTVYRATGPGFADEAAIGNAPASARPTYVDVKDLVLGTTYRYRVRANATDENESPFSSSVTATPSTVNAASVDSTPPAAPAAASLLEQGSYFRDDGTILGKLKISVPAVTGAARGVNVLIAQRQADLSYGEPWIAAQAFDRVDPEEFWLDDFPIGGVYKIFTRAFSAFGVVSTDTEMTSSPVTITHTATPNPPTSVVYVAGNATGFNHPPFVDNGIGFLSFRANWTAPADKHIAYYRWMLRGADSPTGGSLVASGTTRDTFAIVNVFMAFGGYFFVQAVDRVGIASAWAGGGVNTGPYFAKPSGNLINQNAEDATLSGVKIGAAGASSIRQVVARYVEAVTITVTSTTAQQDVGVSIANRGFTIKPDAGFAPIIGTTITNADREYGCIYNKDNGSNSSAQAWLKLFRYDGGNLPGSGSITVSVEFIQYN